MPYEKTFRGLPPDPPYYSLRKPGNRLDGLTHQQRVPNPEDC